MIFVGLDDTDIAGSRGTNQLARALVTQVADQFRCLPIVRHPLLDDPRVRYTSRNGSESILFEPVSGGTPDQLAARLRDGIADDFIPGSDPGLCVVTDVPGSVIEFGSRCKTELITQVEARSVAAEHEILLEGLGGTEDGVIGALAAVGLAATGNDGRIIQRGPEQDELSGAQPVELLNSLGVEVQQLGTGTPIEWGTIDIGKKLRPNLRSFEPVLFAQEPAGPSPPTHWQAVKLP